MTKIILVYKIQYGPKNQCYETTSWEDACRFMHTELKSGGIVCNVELEYLPSNEA